MPVITPDPLQKGMSGKLVDDFLAGGRLEVTKDGRLTDSVKLKGGIRLQAVDKYTLRSGASASPPMVRVRPKAAPPRGEGDFNGVIMVGRDHQARAPEYLGPGGSRVEDQARADLVWDPSRASPHDVELYLRALSGDPAAGVRDDEAALTALAAAGYDPRVATRPPPPQPAWTPADCHAFESGLVLYNKDFFKIRNALLPSRPVSDLVLFYYLWKKSDRHDAFVKKYPYAKHADHTSTEYMDGFLQEPSVPNPTDENYNSNIKKEIVIKMEPTAD